MSDTRTGYYYYGGLPTVKRKTSHDLISRQRDVTARRRLQAAKFSNDDFTFQDIEDRIAAARAARFLDKDQPIN